MPAPLDVDREAVKAHALTHGVREAARAFGLPEDTVKKWSARGKWLARPSVSPHDHLPVTMRPRPVPNVPTASQAALNTLERLGNRSRLNAARAVDRGFRTAAKLPGEAVLAAAPAMASLAKVAEKCLPESWLHKSETGGLLSLHVTVRPPDDPSILDGCIELSHD